MSNKSTRNSSSLETEYPQPYITVIIAFRCNRERGGHTSMVWIKSAIIVLSLRIISALVTSVNAFDARDIATEHMESQSSSTYRSGQRKAAHKGLVFRLLYINCCT